MTFLRLTSLFAAAALALAAAASGALAPSDYRAQANAACAKAKAQSKAFGQTAVNPTAAEVVKSVAGALAVSRQEYASLRALKPPASLAAAHRRALGFLFQEIVLVTKEVEQMQAGADWIKAISATGPAALRLLLRESAAWGAAGVAVCSSGGFSVHFP